MTAADIRAEAIERIARAFYEAEAADELATTGIALPPWDRLNKSDAHRAIGDARLAVDALGDLLPTGIAWGDGEVEDHTVDPPGVVPHCEHDTEDESRECADANSAPVMRRYVGSWAAVR